MNYAFLTCNDRLAISNVLLRTQKRSLVNSTKRSKSSLMQIVSGEDREHSRREKVSQKKGLLSTKTSMMRMVALKNTKRNSVPSNKRNSQSKLRWDLSSTLRS